jgi:hypothetical protein
VARLVELTVTNAPLPVQVVAAEEVKLLIDGTALTVTTADPLFPVPTQPPVLITDVMV